MLRKNLAIILLLFAQVIVLGHGLVSHHHHTDLASHHHHDQVINDHHSDQNPLELAFTEFNHVGEHILFTNPDASKTILTKQVLQESDVLLCCLAFQVDYMKSFKKHSFPPDSYNIYQSPLSGAYTLRGPPSFIVV